MEEARGVSSPWRFAEADARQSAEGWPLRKRLMWRIGELTSAQSIDLAKHVEHFPEVMSAYTLNEIRPFLVPHDDEGKLISKASLEDGGSIRLTGFLMDAGQFVGQFRRRIQFDRDLAMHESLIIARRFRGQGIGARFVHRSLDLYDALGLEQVGLKASLTTGRWYWAQMGFDFVAPGEVEPIRAWAEKVCGATDVKVEGLDEISGAPQFARLEGSRQISFGEIVAALPEHGEEVATVAEENGFALDDVMGIGKAIMLTGPDWTGRLDLEGAQRRSFDEALLERSARAQERSENKLRELEAAAQAEAPVVEVDVEKE